MTQRHQIKKQSVQRSSTFFRTRLYWIGWFTLFNAGIIVVMMSRYLQFTGPIEDLLAHIYAAALLIGHPFFLCFSAALTVLFPVSLLRLNHRVLMSVGIATATLGMAVLGLDYVVYSQFRVHLNKVMLDLVIGGGREIFDFSWQNYAIAMMCVAGVLALQIIFAWFAWKKANGAARRIKGLPIFVIVLVSIIASHGLHAWADAHYYRPITALSRHFPLYYPLTAKRLLQKKGWVDLAQNRDQSKLNMSPTITRTISYPLTTPQFSPVNQHYNFLFIVIDSWRFDAIGPEVTPNIHRFISTRPVWRFNHHLSGGNGTRIGIFSLFYGLSGVHWDAMTSEQVGPLLIQELKNRDYAMGIFASAKLTTPPFNRNVFIDIDNLRSFSQGKTAWERDQSALRDWSQWIAQRDPKQNFFGFVFFDAAHTYSIPPDYPVVFKPMWSQVNYLALNEDLDPTPFYNRYKVSIHYIDSLTKRVLSDLEQHDLLGNTIIVFTGDHGQEFNDTQRNFWGHGGNYTDFQIQVPLAIYWPGREPKVITHQTSHLDVAPTLLKDAMGCQNPLSDYSDGRHLLESEDRDWLVVGGYFNYAIREKERITMAYSNGNYEIFDLNHQIIKDARLNYGTVAEAMQQASRFYRTGP